MNDDDWLDAGAACALLGVKRTTLYAYVSRGFVRAQRDLADPRRSLYARRDLVSLADRNRRPRAHAAIAARAIRWGDPVLTTAISGIRDGRLWFGTEDAVALAERLTFEQIAAHHWRANIKSFPCSDPVAATASPGLSPVGAAMRYLVDRAERAVPLPDLDRSEITATGASLVHGIAAHLIALSVPARAPLHLALADAWRLDASRADLLRRAMVLLSDHELNPSTFAVRVAASAGASLPAALLAGLSTLAGALHGGTAEAAGQVIDAELRREPLTSKARTNPYAVGYGHPIYPEGDPRADAILRSLGASHPEVRAVRRIARELDAPPNVDSALVAMTRALGLPDGTSLTVFALSRTVGWIAHAMEQAESCEIIRPRAAMPDPR